MKDIPRRVDRRRAIKAHRKRLKKQRRHPRLNVGKVLSHLVLMFCSSRFGSVCRTMVQTILYFEMLEEVTRGKTLAVYTWILLLSGCHCKDFCTCRVLSGLIVIGLTCGSSVEQRLFFGRLSVVMDTKGTWCLFSPPKRKVS